MMMLMTTTMMMMMLMMMMMRMRGMKCAWEGVAGADSCQSVAPKPPWLALPQLEKGKDILVKYGTKYPCVPQLENY